MDILQQTFTDNSFQLLHQRSLLKQSMLGFDLSTQVSCSVYFLLLASKNHYKLFQPLYIIVIIGFSIVMLWSIINLLKVCRLFTQTANFVSDLQAQAEIDPVAKHLLDDQKKLMKKYPFLKITISLSVVGALGTLIESIFLFEKTDISRWLLIASIAIFSLSHFIQNIKIKETVTEKYLIPYIMIAYALECLTVELIATLNISHHILVLFAFTGIALALLTVFIIAIFLIKDCCTRWALMTQLRNALAQPNASTETR